MFRGITWPTNPACIVEAFSDAEFNRQADFAGADFKAFAAFRGALFNREVFLPRDVISKKAAMKAALRGLQGPQLRRMLYKYARDKIIRDGGTASDSTPQKQLTDVPGAPAARLHNTEANHGWLDQLFAGTCTPSTLSLAPDQILDKPEMQKKRKDLARKDFKKLLKVRASKKTKDKYMQDLELGARALKIGLENARDNMGEQRMFRLELIALSRQRPFYKNFLSYLYQGSSDFGLSFGRPLFCLAVMWLGLGMLYANLAPSPGSAAPGETATEMLAVPVQKAYDLPDGLDFSLQATLRPFVHLSDSNIRECSFAAALIYGQTGPAAACLHRGPDTDTDTTAPPPADRRATLRSVSMRFLSAMQSLISIILLFLSGIAARRRFQMRS